MTDTAKPPGSGKVLCPICKTDERTPKYRPFCSARCADLDLHRWLAGQYAVPAVEPPDDLSELDELQNGDDSGDEDSSPELH